MSVDLIAVLAILVTSLVEATFLGSILYRMRDKMDANDAALQCRRIEETLKAMREELTKPR